MTHRVLVVGGSGTLGSHIRSALAAAGELDVVVGFRRPSADPGGVHLDVEDDASISTVVGAGGFSAVVVAAPQSDPAVQRSCAAHGVPCLDVSPADALRRTDQPELRSTATPLVTMCGLYPGLSGVMAEAAASGLDHVEEIHVGLLQSTNASAGPAGVKDMLGTLLRPVQTPEGEKPGFTITRPMDFGPCRGRVTVRRMQYDEARILEERFPTAAVAYHTAWSSRPLTLMIAGLHRAGLLRRLVQSRLRIAPRHRPSAPEIAYLSVEAVGTIQGVHAARGHSVEVRSDYGATAAVVAAVVPLMLNQPRRFSGVVTPMEALSLDELRPLLDSRMITFV